MIEIRNRKTNRLLYRAYADSLEGVDLRGAYLFRADLAGANLRGADLSDADLREATLAGADLTGAALRHVLLFQADLTGARLDGADLRGAMFWRTKLLNTDLTRANLAGAWYSRTLRWPEGFDPQAAGALREGVERLQFGKLYRETLGGAPRWVIKWGDPDLFFEMGLLGAGPGDMQHLGIKMLPALSDWLEIGPQHVDLSQQAQLREAFFSDTDRQQAAHHDLKCLDAYEQALAGGESVIFWCSPHLGSCLGVLWALDALHQRGVDFRHASFLLWPNTPGEPLIEVETRPAFEQLVPVPEVLEPLITVRRHLASDSDIVEADLSDLPPRMREWVAVTNYMTDYLPDERGLDVPDAHLLNLLTADWQSGSANLSRFPSPREPGWGVLYTERLLALSGSGLFALHHPEEPGETLVQARARRDGKILKSHFRITPLGSRVRAGEEDALARGLFHRWVGGRLISNKRPIRRKMRIRRLPSASLSRGPR
jgi:hypothetical protein